MASTNPEKSANRPVFENRLRERRQTLGLSQKQLADMAGITRQAVCAVEAGQYSPATLVALQLAQVLHCKVEDLFSIKTGGEIIEGELVGSLPQTAGNVRVQVIQIGARLLVRPLDGLGELTSLSATADGLTVIESVSDNKRVKVKLLKDREAVRRKIVVAGCDPAMFLAAEHLGRWDKQELATHLVGNGIAIDLLKRGEVHVAGVHLANEGSSAGNRPDLERNLKGMDCLVVTFAHWEEGLIVKRGNQKKIRRITDLARPAVKIVNRENGSGARRLLDRELETAGIQRAKVKGYGDEVFSHLEVASRVKAGMVDTGVGVQAAASIFGLDFIPLQRERYDLVIPRAHYEALPGLKTLLDMIVRKPFRDEIEALGGYDTRATGEMRDLKVA
jgi:putative molybdopterin biosynthesis protein